PRVQPDGTEHATVLGVHAGDDRPRRARVRLRPLQAGQREPSLQATVGRDGRPASLAAVVAGKRRGHAVAGAPSVPPGKRGLAAPPPLHDQADWTRPRPADSVTVRTEPLPRARLTAFGARRLLCRQL